MDADDLPLPDYDHLPSGSMVGRIRSVDADGLRDLIEYEQEHGKRFDVLVMLENRLEQVLDGAELSAGGEGDDVPESASAPDGGSPVAPETQGPPQNPPAHGDPTNPAQPRR